LCVCLVFVWGVWLLGSEGGSEGVSEGVRGEADSEGVRE
jgi:hypothetical protein